MDRMYLFCFFMAGILFFGAKSTGRGRWNEEYTSLKQTKVLQGAAAPGGHAAPPGTEILCAVESADEHRPEKVKHSMEIRRPGRCGSR